MPPQKALRATAVHISGASASNQPPTYTGKKLCPIASHRLQGTTGTLGSETARRLAYSQTNVHS